MKDSTDYYFAVEKIKNFYKEELIDVFNKADKDWRFYGPPSKNTLWILPVELEVFYNTLLGSLITKDYVESVAFMLVKAKGRVKPHADTRPTSFLCPIMGDFDKSVLKFYNTYISKKVVPLNNDSESIVNSATIYNVGEPDTVISYNSPIIINSHIIHSVDNYSNTDRINFSITLKRNLSYREVLHLYQNNRLLLT